MSPLARVSRLERERFHGALSSEGNPEFAAILKPGGALGLQLQVLSTALRATWAGFRDDLVLSGQSAGHSLTD